MGGRRICSKIVTYVGECGRFSVGWSRKSRRGCEAVNKTKSFLRARLNPTVYSALSKTKQALWHSGNTSEPAQTDLGKLAEIGEPFSSVLRSMYSGQPQKGLDGQDHELRLDTRISVEEGACLVFAETRKRNAPWRLAALTASALSIFWPPSAPIQPPHTLRSIHLRARVGQE